jgi:hypothetical protein
LLIHCNRTDSGEEKSHGISLRKGKAVEQDAHCQTLSFVRSRLLAPQLGQMRAEYNDGMSTGGSFDQLIDFEG